MLIDGVEYSADYKLFKVLDKTMGGTPNGLLTNGITLKLDYALTKARKLINYRLNSGSNIVARNPKDWTIEGLDINGVWNVVDTQSGIVFGAIHTWSSLFTIASPSLYYGYRLNITLNNGDATYVAFGELEFNFEISDAPYLNTLDKVVYDSGDVATDLVALGECKVDTQGNTFDLVEYEPLQSYFNDVIVQGEASLNSNVKIVDFGTVFSNNRYMLDNPFGNENYDGCIAEVQIFDEGKWKIPHEMILYTSSYYYRGVTVDLYADGIAVKTSVNGLAQASIGDFYSNITTAPCRVIVTKIGDATDA